MQLQILRKKKTEKCLFQYGNMWRAGGTYLKSETNIPITQEMSLTVFRIEHTYLPTRRASKWRSYRLG